MHKYIRLLVSLSVLMIFAEAQAVPRKLQVYAHRGVRAYAPENTIPGYELALRTGADWLDMDVVLTKEGEVIVSHDPVLNPDIVRDAQGRFLAKDVAKYTVKNLTVPELQKFDVGRMNPDSAYAKFFPEQKPVDGTRMPLLSEVIRYVKKNSKNKIGFQIEMKTDPAHPEYSADPATFAKALNRVLVAEKISDRVEVRAEQRPGPQHPGERPVEAVRDPGEADHRRDPLQRMDRPEERG